MKMLVGYNRLLSGTIHLINNLQVGRDSMADQAIMHEIMETVKKLPPENLQNVLEFLKTLSQETDDPGEDDSELLTMDKRLT